MPKMSGPQSDKDVAMYRQMAGAIGDPTIPADQKLAAMQTIREIQNRYAGIESTSAPQWRSIKLDDGSSVIAKRGSDGGYYVTRNGKTYRVEE